ncbi:MAG: RDD family protein [Bacteroidota bacterium]
MNKKITLFAYVNAIAGIAAELAGSLPFGDQLTLHTVRNFFEGFWLDILDFRLLYWNYLNGFNLLANILLLLGAQQFSRSGGKKSRLLSYTLAVLMISSTFSLIEVAFFSSFWLTAILNGLKCAALAWFSWVSLRHLSNTREPDAASNSNEGQRALNWLIDTTTIFLAFTPYMFVSNLLRSYMSMVIFLVIARLIYYIFFEITLRATPGKLATGTEVMSSDELLPNPVQIVVRTLCRFIPFEALSFFVTQGGHDTLSQTKVVNSKQIE